MGNWVYTLGIALLVIWIQHDVITDRTAERDAALRELQSANLAIDELAVERARADLRYQLVLSSRESILTATPEDDGGVAPVLWTGLRAADEIGDLE
jgi:hypothetical protein